MIDWYFVVDNSCNLIKNILTYEKSFKYCIFSEKAKYFDFEGIDWWYSFIRNYIRILISMCARYFSIIIVIGNFIFLFIFNKNNKVTDLIVRLIN